MEIIIMENELHGLFRGRNAKVVVPAIFSIIEEMDEHLPMTVRQVYYQLVAREIIPNRQSEYQNVSRVLTTLRRNDHLPWNAIEDRTRRLIEKRGVTDLETHVEENAQYLFRGYDRCLVQNQDNYVEIFTEKDALASIIEDACHIYCTRVVVVRGQVSSTFIHQYAERADKAIMRGQQPIILYIGDLDPSGLRIPVALAENLAAFHDIDVDLRRIALTPDQVQRHHLPASLDAVKPSDPNYRWFRDQGHSVAAEVDALHPGLLKECIVNGLCDVLDVNDMLAQQGVEARERDVLKKLERMFAEDCRKLGINYHGAYAYM
jgi:hypothetical protein